jgi:preprotein translocase subunit YajC
VISVVLAQETPAAGGGWFNLVFLALLVGVFYFLIIRPQRKRSQQQRELAASLGVGDEVRTIGGIHGVVVSLDEESVVLRIEDGQVRISRRAVGNRVGDQPGASE